MTNTIVMWYLGPVHKYSADIFMTVDLHYPFKPSAHTRSRRFRAPKSSNRANKSDKKSDKKIGQNIGQNIRLEIGQNIRQKFVLKIGQNIEQEMGPENRTRNRTNDQT